MRVPLRLLLGVAVCFGFARAFAAEKVAVAAAANLTYILAPLDAEFERLNPGVAVASEIGSSGSLVAQIKNGAPYDVFLSADVDFPRRLIAAGGAEKSSLVTFAFGRLVLWTTKTDVALASIEATVRDPAVRKIAVANPKLAPYGRAAEEALARLGLTAEAAPKLVFGENITQTAQFVSSGNADAGFVAYSLVVAPQLTDKGHWIEVPAALFTPIAQGAVLTTRGASNPAARRFMQFIVSPEGRPIFERFGYGLP